MVVVLNLAWILKNKVIDSSLELNPSNYSTIRLNSFSIGELFLNENHVFMNACEISPGGVAEKRIIKYFQRL